MVQALVLCSDLQISKERIKETYSGFNGYVDTGFHLKVTAIMKERMKETYSGFNGYGDTGLHLKVTSFISIASLYDFSGEGPTPPFPPVFLFC